MDLSDRLKSLGVRLNGAKPVHPQENSRPFFPIEQVVSGHEEETEFGSIFTSVNSFTSDYSHGAISMNSTLYTEIMAAWSHSERLGRIEKSKIAFLDTETSGLAGGTGTYAFLIGVGSYQAEGYQVTQFFMRHPGDEPALLAALLRHLAQFEVIVTFNGKSFDVPLINTRLTLNQFSLPFGSVDHIDLLHLARRLWRNRLASRALGDLEREILNFTRTSDEVPGYLIPQIYFDFLASGDARPLAGVFYHNVIDIVSLAALFQYVAEMLDRPDINLLPSLDVVAIARLYEENGRLEQAADLYENGISAGLPQDIYHATIERFATLRRKQGSYGLAAALWERAAKLGDLQACRELSKIYEHSLRLPAPALYWARQGLEFCKSQRLSKFLFLEWSGDFQKRIDRLEKKVNHDTKH